MSDARPMAHGCERTPRPDDELREIARGIVEQRIFCGMHVEDAFSFPHVFLVLGWADQEWAAQLEANREYMPYVAMSKASPRGFNGYPSFLSIDGMMTETETMRVIEYHNKMLDALESVR